MSKLDVAFSYPHQRIAVLSHPYQDQVFSITVATCFRHAVKYISGGLDATLIFFPHWMLQPHTDLLVIPLASYDLSIGARKLAGFNPKLNHIF